MKKLKYFFFVSVILLSIIPTCIFSQYSKTIFLHNNGVPITGQAANLEFTRYPHSYPANVISGITVTETPASSGTYVARGFTVYEYVRLWKSGVYQSGYDSTLVGDIVTSYLIPNYPRLSISNNFTGSTNTFVSGVFTGAVTVEGSFFEAVDPYISNLGDPYLLYQHSQNSLVHVRLADSIYGRKGWYKDGDKFRMLTSDNKWYGRANTVPPFEINTSQFQWANDKLNLLVFGQDSLASKMYSNWKDSTWLVLGEPVSKYRILTLKKRFWATPTDGSRENTGYFDWKWYYETVSESGVRNLVDSALVINHGANSVGYEYPDEYFAVDSWTTIDTVVFPLPGLYLVTYHAELIFPYTVVSGVDARDSVQFRFAAIDNDPNIVIESSVLTLWKDFANTATGLGSPIEQFYQPESNPISRTFLVQHTSGQTDWHLQIRADLNSALINVAATKPLITYQLIK